MYYILNCLDPMDGYIPRLEYKNDDPFRFWISGESFTDSPPTPIKINVMSDRQTILPEMWTTPITVMSIRLYEVLKQSGIDNMDIYQVDMTDMQSGDKIEGYVAFNLIGLVPALDIRRSVISSKEDLSKIKGDIDIDKMIIDHKKVSDFDLFRLAEAPGLIIISEKLKKIIENAEINTLTFSEPEQWIY